MTASATRAPRLPPNRPRSPGLKTRLRDRREAGETAAGGADNVDFNDAVSQLRSVAATFRPSLADGQLDPHLDHTFQEPSPVCQVVAFGHELVKCRGGDRQRAPVALEH